MKIFKLKGLVHPPYPVGSNTSKIKTFAIQVSSFLVKYLDKELNRKDIVMWCRGSSGSILASAVCMQLPDNYCTYISYIKKEDESRHSHVTKQYDTYSFNIFIDDFMSSGDTVRKSLEFIYNHQLNKDSVIKLDLLIVGGDINFNHDFLLQHFNNFFSADAYNTGHIDIDHEVVEVK